MCNSKFQVPKFKFQASNFQVSNIKRRGVEFQNSNSVLNLQPPNFASQFPNQICSVTSLTRARHSNGNRDSRISFEDDKKVLRCCTINSTEPSTLQVSRDIGGGGSRSHEGARHSGTIPFDLGKTRSRVCACATHRRARGNVSPRRKGWRKTSL